MNKQIDDMANKKTFDHDTLFIYLLFLYPVIAIITALLSMLYSLNITVTHYAFILLIYSYFIIFKKKLFFKSLLIPFLILYLLNILISTNSWISIRDLMPINLLINLIIIIYSEKIKILKLNNTFKNILFSVTLAGFFIFIFGVDLMIEAYIGNYHAGLFGSPHRAAAYLFVIFVYSALVDKKINLFYILSFIGIFLTGVRTFIVALIIFILFDLFSKIVLFKREDAIYLFKFISVIFVLSLLAIILRPPIVDNMYERLGELVYVDDIDDYGSGRVEIAQFLLSDIYQRKSFNFLVGTPVINQYESAEREFGLPLWAHNDFLMILYTLGLLGFIIYSYYIFIKPVKYLFKQKILNNDMSIFISGFGLLLSIIFIAIANGFYYYLMLHIIFYILYVNNKGLKSLRVSRRKRIKNHDVY